MEYYLKCTNFTCAKYRNPCSADTFLLTILARLCYADCDGGQKIPGGILRVFLVLILPPGGIDPKANGHDHSKDD